MIRLDKLLGHSGYGTRKEIKSLCKNGDVTVNGEIVRDSSVKVDEGATVIVAGEKVEYEAVSYLMLHKPAGVVSATQDSRVRTVLDILPSRYAASRVAPVGRLDIDTTGLLLLSNDGTWAHKVISPKKHVPKVYEAQVEGLIPDDVGERFAAGIVLEDGLECLLSLTNGNLPPELFWKTGWNAYPHGLKKQLRVDCKLPFVRESSIK